MAPYPQLKLPCNAALYLPLIILLLSGVSGYQLEASSSGSGEGGFLESNGLIVIEVESATHDPQHWSLESGIAGFSGQAYLVGKTDTFKQGGLGKMRYPFKVSNSGTYQLQWKSRITVGDSRGEHNDAFARILDENETLLDTVNHENERDADPSWYKVFMNRLDQWSYDAKNVDGVGIALAWDLEAGKTYYFEISVRSQGVALDRIVLWEHSRHSFGDKVTGRVGNEAPLDALGQSVLDGVIQEPDDFSTTLGIVELRDSIVDEKALNFADVESTKFGRNINGKTHQQWPIQTFNGHQYVTYYDEDRYVCLGRRHLPDGDWEIIRFTDHQITSNDSHNVTVIGISEGDGSIHLAFDHHADDLNYRHSIQGLASDPEAFEWNASLFSEVKHELGPNGPIAKFTYPRFVPMPNGNLMLYYRNVTSGNGDSMIREYDSTTHQWKTTLGKFIARDIGTYSWGGEVSQYRYAYINAISYAGSRLHVSWVWRDRFDKTSMTNNHDVCYAYSDDNGQTWQNTFGEQIAVTGSSFINVDSPGIIVGPVNPGQNLINQCTHFAFPDGTIHVMMRHYIAGTTTTKYHHYWRDITGAWHSQVLDFSGSRPSLIGDEDKNLILVYTSGNRTNFAHGVPNQNATDWLWSAVYTQTAFTDGGEGVIDFSRWQGEQIISTYSQESVPDQFETPTPLHVADYVFTDSLELDSVYYSATNELELSWIYGKHELQVSHGELSEGSWTYHPEGASSPVRYALGSNPDSVYFRLAPPAPTEIARRYDWDDGDENIYFKDMDHTVSNGVLVLTLSASRSDPYIRMNDGGFNADIYDRIRVRVRNNSPGSQWRMYFRPDGGSEGGNSVPFSIPANSGWETIDVDMTADPDWQGQIQSTRIDFGTAVNGTVEIDYIEIYRK